MHLIVKSPFDGFERGDKITKDVEAIAARHPAKVIRIASPPPKSKAAPDAPSTDKPA